LHVVDRDRTPTRLRPPVGPRGQRRPRPRAGRLALDARAPVDAGAPVRARSLLGDLGRLLSVVALVGDEVREDDLLDVAELGVHGRERLQRGDALLLGLADADEDAG